MKENKLIINIQKPVNYIFDYTINPINTPKWIKNIQIEETNEWPIKIGTIYRNKNNSGQWSEYSVSDLKQNRFFELKTKDGNYHVHYSYKPIDKNNTKLEYFEWVENGELLDPFTHDILERLKSAIEGPNEKISKRT